MVALRTFPNPVVVDLLAVEEVLGEMVAKGYVDVDNVPQSGVIVYRFPELTGPFH